MTWFLDKRTGMTSPPWRVLPALPLFVAIGLLCLLSIVPVVAVVAVAHRLYLAALPKRLRLREG